MSDIELKHWTGKQLIYFSEYIHSPTRYGWSLLALHNTIWGMKMFDMLKLKWSHLLDEDLKPKQWMEYEKNDSVRPIESSTIILRSLRRIIDMDIDIKLDEPIYVNHKGKLLNTSTLNREFNSLVEEFKKVVTDKTGLPWNLKPIKTNTFQIAWALDMLEEFDCHKSIFGIVSRHMKHNSIADTVKLLGVEPREEDEVFLLFNNHSFREALDFQNMDSEKIKEVFYNIPRHGIGLHEEGPHISGLPI